MADSAPPRPLLAALRRFSATFVNPITRRFAGWLPGFGIIEHTGRRTGKRYRTPMNVFRDGNEWILALTYGSDVEWLKNIMAAEGCRLVTRRKRVVLVNPRVFVDPGRTLMPLPVRVMLALLRVSEFVRLSAATEPTEANGL